MHGWDKLQAEYGGLGAMHNSSHANCRDVGANTVPMAIFGRAANAIDRIGVECSSMIVRRINGTWQLDNWWTPPNQGPFGSAGGTEFTRSCPLGTLMERINLQVSGTLVQAISPECTRPTIPMSPVVP